ncbi:prolyl oligopeptidase family serine peptidase [Planomicrobium sp. CPCC 101079]|uniref:prolyl oligopeptidase family serine peptidase n=1 Tax=Planomicrobium sp. CPCC 101079 TaxID=2599618 RepID=UPI0011B4B046|nr:prolyl oligopeptidase family serine peptidase [Planomicrobium sp. CPCC 101079]TWT04867.1 prolyl oligopeptidase family serine peptidase [Planomicrobium sp. CPCC 101079]
MKVEHEVWRGIPLLHVAPEQQWSEPLPTVVFFHGITSAKEHNLHYAYQLAEKGVRVLLPDALLHGERTENLSEMQLIVRFWEIILNSIKELDYINQIAHDKQLVKGEMAIGGTSMGGITTLGALAAYPWIKAASVMMGAGNYVELSKGQIVQFESRGYQLPFSEQQREELFETLGSFDSTKNLEAFNQRPVFFWHGEQDPVVAFEPTFNLYNQLKEYYREAPELLYFMREREAGHAVSRQGMLAATDWLAKHVKA